MDNKKGPLAGEPKEIQSMVQATTPAIVSSIMLRPQIDAPTKHLCQACGKLFAVTAPAAFWWVRSDDSLPICSNCAAQHGYLHTAGIFAEGVG